MKYETEFYWTDLLTWAVLILYIVFFCRQLKVVTADDNERYEYLGTVVAYQTDVRNIDPKTHEITTYDYYLKYRDDAGEIHEDIKDMKDFEIMDGYVYRNRFVTGWFSRLFREDLGVAVAFLCVSPILLLCVFGIMCGIFELSILRPFRTFGGYLNERKRRREDAKRAADEERRRNLEIKKGNKHDSYLV